MFRKSLLTLVSVLTISNCAINQDKCTSDDYSDYCLMERYPNAPCGDYVNPCGDSELDGMIDARSTKLYDIVTDLLDEELSEEIMTIEEAKEIIRMAVDAHTEEGATIRYEENR